jgi:AraC-like DNA-binding protein
MDTRITRALDYIDQHLDSRLTIDTLAAAAGLSPSRFAHLFRHEVGTSPAQYVHTLRMLRARALLERSFLAVKEVMTLVGCHDPSHFSRDFRSFHGVAPRQCRLGAAGEPREPGVAPVGSQNHAAIARIAALANERRTRTRKPRPRARAPDRTARGRADHEDKQSSTSLKEESHVTGCIGVGRDIWRDAVDRVTSERAGPFCQHAHRPGC